jgi:hypothetical protein
MMCGFWALWMMLLLVLGIEAISGQGVSEDGGAVLAERSGLWWVGRV